MSSFESSITSSIQYRRVDKLTQSERQDLGSISHLTELGFGTSFSEANDVWSHTFVHGPSGDTTYSLSALPTNFFNSTVNTSIIGARNSRIRAFSIHNRGNSNLRVSLPFYSNNDLNLGPSSETLASNMNGWIVTSSDSIVINSNTANIYDILFLGSKIPISITSDHVCSTEYRQELSFSSSLNSEYRGNIAVDMSGDFEHLEDVIVYFTGDTQIRYEHTAGETSSATLLTEHILDFTNDSIIQTESLVDFSDSSVLRHENLLKYTGDETLNTEYSGDGILVYTTSDGVVNIEYSSEIVESGDWWHWW